MSRVCKKEILVKEEELKVGEVVKMGREAPIQDQIALSVLIESQISRLKVVLETLKENIKTTKYGDIIKALESKGLIENESVSPVIKVLAKTGDKINVFLSPDIDSGFEISPEIGKKEILETIVPDKYKKISTLLDRKSIEEDFEKGTLPDILKGYCSKCPMEITRTRKTISKK